MEISQCDGLGVSLNSVGRGFDADVYSSRGNNLFPSFGNNDYSSFNSFDDGFYVRVCPAGSAAKTWIYFAVDCVNVGMMFNCNFIVI